MDSHLAAAGSVKAVSYTHLDVYKRQLYMLQHFMNNMYNKNLDYQRLSASAIMLAIVIIALIALLFAIENYFGKDVEG